MTTGTSRHANGLSLTGLPGRLRRAAPLFLGLVALPLAAAGAARPAATPPRLAVSLAPESLTVGDRVRATLTLTAGSASLAGEPRFPAWGKAWGEAEVVGVSPVERHESPGGAVEYRQTVVLTAFRPGRIALPPRRVAVPGAGETREVATPEKLALSVRSVLPAAGASGDAVPKPKPPAAPRALPVGRAFWWTLAAMGLAAAGAVGAAVARSRSRARAGSAAAARPALPPAEELAASLAETAREGSPERAHVALSFALRRYLGRRLGFPALESTTSEVRRELRGRRAPEAVAERTAEILGACDRVKFAREPAARPAFEARLEAVREVADRLEAYLAPPPASSRGRAA